MNLTVSRRFGSLGWAAIALAVALASPLGAAPARAAGLKLHAIAGPNGAIPFRSPAGAGPTSVASPPGDERRLFITTKDGYVFVMFEGSVLPTPVLDLSAQTDTYNANGMFSIAFDPDYATNRLFYITYTDISGGPNSNQDNEHVDAFRMSAGDPNVADPSSQVQILEVPHIPCLTMTTPHFGGQLAFGPDDHLWLSIGDGGDDCNTELGALDFNSWHGKIVRIDPRPDQAPDADGNRYVVPPDNPLVGQSNVRPEIWAFGLRNPYRFSFDAATGDLILGDVGLATEEEVDRVATPLAPGDPPPFFGWPCYEGNDPIYECTYVSETPIAPLFVKEHGTDPATGGSYCTAVIGGYVLHDPSLQGDFDGRYLYGYFCAQEHPRDSGRLFTTDLDAPSPTPRDEGLIISGSNPNTGFGLSSFGEDACGHPYAMNVIFGGLYRIEGPTPGPCGEYVPPQTAVDAAPPSVTAKTTAELSFSSSVGGSTFECSLDSGAASPCTSPASYPGLAEGPHTFAVAATDEAGHADASPATAAWTVDTTPPQTTIDSAPSGTLTTRGASISFSSSLPNSTFACSLDGAPAGACTSPVNYTGLADGEHTFSVAAANDGGIPDPSAATATWTVDATPPQTTITARPGSLVASATATFAFASTRPEATFACSVDGGPATPCTSPLTYTGVGDGAHTFSVTSTNGVGIADASPPTASWTVDTTRPETSLSDGPSGVTTSRTATFSFSSSENDSTFSCSLDGAAPTPCTSPLTYTKLAAGAHSFTVLATDAAGNPSTAAAVTSWTVMAPTPRPRLAFTARHPVAIVSKQRVRIRLRPMAGAAGATVTTRSSRHRAAARRSFRIVAGRRTVVRPRLTARARHCLQRRHVLRVRVTVRAKLDGGRRLRLARTFALRR